MSKKSAAGAWRLAGVPPKAGRPREAGSERDRFLSDPERYRELDRDQQSTLVAWICDVLVPSKTVFRRNSYAMKHDFEKERDGFYICNGAFKGAMLAAGYRPEDADELHWCFRVRPAHPLSLWEQRKLRRWGRGLLVCDRWRDVGYVVLQPTQRMRDLEHRTDCQRERRPRVVVTRTARYTSKVMLDMARADCRLTPEAIAAILARFDVFDPKGRNSYVSDTQLAEIWRVPMHRAEELAAALVSIAQGCSMVTQGQDPEGPQLTREIPKSS